MGQTQAFQRISELSRRPDVAATRELVAFFEQPDAGLRLQAARALLPRTLPGDLRERVAALLFLDSSGVEHELLACAAKALLEQASDKAFLEAAPLLQPQAMRAPTGLLRAHKVLSAVEERLAHANTVTGAEHGRSMPDPRFRALCEQLRTSDQALRSLAMLVVDGFRHFEGEDVRPAARRVDLGEEGDPPFPFVIAGFFVDTSTHENALEAALEKRGPPHPPGLSWFEHQFGGRACLQATLFGYGVSIPSTCPVLMGLEELSRDLYDTEGERMDAASLGKWGQRLQELLWPQGLEHGAESLLLAHPRAPIEVLRGWDVLEFCAHAPWRKGLYAPSDSDITRCGRYAEAHEQVLSDLGQSLGLGVPRIAILWGNSD